MAKNTIKGLTIEIGGDTTKLGAALEDVNKKSQDLSQELGQINKLLKMDPGNTDLLAQKQKVLADAVANTSKKLDTLKEAERQVQQQFERGEVSEAQVRELQREIIATTNKLEGYKNAARETAAAVEDLGDEAEESADNIAEMGDHAGSVAAGGFKALTAGVAAAAAALVAAAESTREYRTAMGKLDTAFTTAGHTSAAATDTYKTLQGVLGETDQAVEAASHLAQLANNEKDLATWTDIATGVYATFGASLPIENLTEASNETAKTGALTGGLADALNWAGVNEEDFQAKLDACSTEQERQALITSTLNGLYSEAANKYRETNAEVIASNEANEAWTASLAEVGAEVEPLLTSVKNLGAELLGNLVPVIQGLKDNLPAVAVAAAGVTAALVSYKIAALAAKAAQEGMTLTTYILTAAQHALNVALNANPIGLVILAITALVTAFVALWNNCDAFRQFWIDMWEGIKTAFFAVVDFVKNNWQALLLFLVNPVGATFKLLYDNFEGFRDVVGNVLSFIKKGFSNIVDFFATLPARVSAWASNIATRAKEGATQFLNNVVAFINQLPERVGYFLGSVLGKVASFVVTFPAKAKEAATKFINNVVTFFKTLPGKVQTWLQNTITKVSTWASNMATKAKTAAVNFVEGAINTIKSLPGKIWKWLQDTVAKVVAWGQSMVQKAKDGVQKMVKTVTDTIKSLPEKMKNIGKDLVEGLWNGIKNMGNWIKEKITGFASGLLKGFRDNFDINSPSRETEWMGEMLDEGLAEGISNKARSPLSALTSLSEDMLNEVEGMNGLTLQRRLEHTFDGADTGAAAAQGGLLAKLDSILAAIERGQILTIDGDALVGSTINAYDNKLGQRRALAARGAL